MCFSHVDLLVTTSFTSCFCLDLYVLKQIVKISTVPLYMRGYIFLTSGFTLRALQSMLNDLRSAHPRSYNLSELQWSQQLGRWIGTSAFHPQLPTLSVPCSPPRCRDQTAKKESCYKSVACSIHREVCWDLFSISPLGFHVVHYTELSLCG